MELGFALGSAAVVLNLVIILNNVSLLQKKLKTCNMLQMEGWNFGMFFLSRDHFELFFLFNECLGCIKFC